MAKSKDYIPRGDAEFNTWFKNLTQYIGVKCGGSTPEWTHIPSPARTELNNAYADWYTYFAATLKPHTKAETTEKNDARKRAEKAIRPFVKQYLRFKPVSNGDRDNMGIPNYDETRTSHDTVAERVEFYLDVQGIRQVKARFKVLGAEGRAKPSGYDGAVVVWGVLDKPPAEPEDLPNHKLASRTPYTMKFREAERGKTVYAALCWQNGKGIQGPWSEIQSSIIP
jgi:hypothetical protein